MFGKQIILAVSKLATKGVSLVRNSVEAIAMIVGNKSNYTNRDVERAKVTRRFQYDAGHSSDDTLICTATTNGITNLLIVIQDVKLMNAILGNGQYAIKGKSIRGQSGAVKTEYVPVPRSILDRYKNVTLCADVMFVCKVMLFVTVPEIFIMEPCTVCLP